MTTVQQPAFNFDLPAPTNYDGLPIGYVGVPYVKGSETSKAAAEAIAPKVGGLKARVLLALYEMPGLTDEGLNRWLGIPLERPVRPRRNDLFNDGLVEDSGGRSEGASGLKQIEWQLTRKGEEAARRLQG